MLRESCLTPGHFTASQTCWRQLGILFSQNWEKMRIVVTKIVCLVLSFVEHNYINILKNFVKKFFFFGSHIENEQQAWGVFTLTFNFFLLCLVAIEEILCLIFGSNYSKMTEKKVRSHSFHVVVNDTAKSMGDFS